MAKNKRFTLINWDNYAEGDCIYYDDGEEMGSLDVLDTLNGLDGTVKSLTEDYEQLLKENKDLKIKNKGLQSELEIRKADVDYANKISNELFDECKQYKKENAQLKQEVESINSKNKILLEHCDDLQERNDRQAKQLDNIYNLIEKQDWGTLQGLIEEFKECEEQLKIEMECYK